MDNKITTVLNSPIVVNYQIVFWPHDEKYKNYISTAAYFLLSIGVIFGPLNYAIKQYFDHAPFVEFVFNLSIVTSAAFGISFAGMIKISYEKCLKSFKAMDDNPYMAIDHPVLQRNLAFYNRFMFTLAGTVTVFFACYFIYAETESCDENSNKDICGLFFPSYYFIDVSGRPLRDIVNLVYLFAFLYLVDGGSNSIMMLLMVTSYMEFAYDSMCESLEALKTITNKDKRLKHFIAVYKHHEYLMNIWEDYMYMYKWPLFFQMFLCALIVSLIVISEFIEFNFISLGHSLVYIIGTVGFGLVGEKIQQTNEKLRLESFYSIPWDGDIRLASRMMLMNLRCNQPVILPVGNYMAHSNVLALQILKTSYSIVMFYINEIL